MARPVSSVLTSTICGWLVLTVTAAVAADPAAAKAAAKELLENGWSKTAAARAVADRCDLHSPTLAGDSFVAAAHWLVLMNQNQYDKAIDSLNTFFECKPSAGSALYGLRAKAWIQTVKRDYLGAMKTADSLAQAVSPNPSATDAPLSQLHAEAIEFVGHLAGFLEGPAEKSVEDNLQKKWEATIVARFDAPRTKVYDNAKGEALAEFRKLMAEAAGATDEAKVASEAEKQKALEKLAKDNEKLEKEASKSEEKERQLQEELKKTLAEIDRRDALLVNHLNSLQNNLTSLSNQASQAKANADRLNALATREKNADSRQRMQFDANQASNTVNNFQTQMDNVRFQMSDITAQRNTLQQLKQQALGGANIQGQLLENQQRQLEKEKFRNENKQKREQQGKAAATTKTLALEARAHSFSNYDAFPLQELRETLLKNVK